MTVADSIFSFFKKDFPTEKSNPFLGSVIQRNLVKTLCKVSDEFENWTGRTEQEKHANRTGHGEQERKNRKGRT